jgi:5-methylcytosine-specific restriction endonuclease McrA
MKNNATKHAKSSSAKPNAERTWKHLEDHLIPSLRLSVIDRSVYSHLLRHSRLEGRRRMLFSIRELSRRLRISTAPVRDAVRRLLAYGVLRLIQRDTAGHVVDVRLPQEMRALRSPRSKTASGASIDAASASSSTSPFRRRFAIDQTDFLKTPALRNAIHAREAGLCFYCRKRLKNSLKCLDHVIPRVLSGRNSYRNLVSCCFDCNSQKGQRRASDFLRWLFREQRLTASELKGRLAALSALTSGKLVPALS